MSIKELTMGHHKAAEDQPFVGVMFSGKLDARTYAIFAYNQYLMYEALENAALDKDVLGYDFPDINRASALKADYLELWEEASPPPTLETTKKFVQYISEVQDPDSIFAHVYTRHMGDLMGGQMLKSKVPGKSLVYEFKFPDLLKVNIRKRLKDEMVEEVKTAYGFATDTFKEMWTYVEKG